MSDETFDGLEQVKIPANLRDYFAAHALQGLLAAHTGELSLPDADVAAADAYEFADAMLRERE